MSEIITQNPYNNIDQDLDTKSIIIFWKPRNWKTLLACLMCANDYKRIYSNFHIYRNWESIVKYLKTHQAVANIGFSYEHGVIAIDEAGLNLNSKDWFSEQSRALHEVLFLSGKKNCDMITLAQRYESIDINFRVLASLILECTKIKRVNGKPTFHVKKWKEKNGKKILDGQYIIDSISYMQALWITYDTLDASKMKREKETDVEPVAKTKIVYGGLASSLTEE